EGGVFFCLLMEPAGIGAMRVPSPAAGIITTTFIAGCQYTSGWWKSSNASSNAGSKCEENPGFFVSLMPYGATGRSNRNCIRVLPGRRISLHRRSYRFRGARHDLAEYE